MKKSSLSALFEDTATAFRYKSDAAVRKAYLIFSLLNHPWLSAIASGAATLALKLRLPVEFLIRKTVFDLFCGGEIIESTALAVERLGKYAVHTILDYSVEGENTEAGFDHVMQETIRTIERASKSPFIPFSVFKVTGLGHAALLEKVHSKSSLTKGEAEAFERVQHRVQAICQKASELDIPILIDAEETWIQDPIDDLAYDMMKRYNAKRAIVFNTFQLYRVQGLLILKDAWEAAAREGYFLGAKIVRGAYMEKERGRAEKMGYENPIHPDKDATDKAFNEGLEFCIQHHDRIAMMCGSHNEYSSQYLTTLMKLHHIEPADERVWFAQLYGMSDNISFNLASEGYRVAKYVPYGPVRSVMPYLLRRAAENTSVAGQSSRELVLIRKELNRRKASR
ncbi:MAG: proline dehydrogenase family protein [Chryseolinea sp.]